MICRKKSYQIGHSVAVKHCWGGYLLPNGLPEGATVKVLATETGYVHVEFQGKHFIVSMACVESGWEYRLHGRWRDEGDPIIVELLQNGNPKRLSTRRASQSFSSATLTP